LYEMKSSTLSNNHRTTLATNNTHNKHASQKRTP